MHNPEDQAVAAQQEQLDAIGERLSEIKEAARVTDDTIAAQQQMLENLDRDLEGTVATLPQDVFASVTPDVGALGIELTSEEEREVEARFQTLFAGPIPTIDGRNDWSTYTLEVEKYFAVTGAKRRNLVDLLSPDDHQIILKQLRDECTYKTAHCDRLDYTLACACGLLGALIDVVFVGAPGQGALTHFTDDFADRAVMRFAKIFRWPGPEKDSDPLKSAIGYLENTFKVIYDQKHPKDLGPHYLGKIYLRPKNHHIKNLEHAPDPIGLFFSILSQFTNTAHFVEKGKLITVETEPLVDKISRAKGGDAKHKKNMLVRLQGHNVPAKIFAGFVNWFGHLMSDLAGSSGAKGRGSGIPMPFFELLQFINVGEFGQYHQAFGTVCVKVFEEGYDMRHGMALAIPLLLTELMTRLCWTLKQKFHHKKDWGDCLSSANNPELHHMLFVAYGAFCMVDAGDAALRSGGQIVAFLLNTNIIAWSRFAILAIHEAQRSLLAGKIDHAAVDKYLDAEFARLLANS